MMFSFKVEVRQQIIYDCFRVVIFFLVDSQCPLLMLKENVCVSINDVFLFSFLINTYCYSNHVTLQKISEGVERQWVQVMLMISVCSLTCLLKQLL